jgi:hypothetical protein
MDAVTDAVMDAVTDAVMDAVTDAVMDAVTDRVLNKHNNNIKIKIITAGTFLRSGSTTSKFVCIIYLSFGTPFPFEASLRYR